MNEALRLLRKVVRRWGYDLKRSEQFVLRPVKGLDQIDSVQALKRVREVFDNTDERKETDLDRVIVYLRTCLRPNRNRDTRRRLTGVSNEENALRCLRSTITAINRFVDRMGQDQISIVVLDDHSDPNMKEHLQSVVASARCKSDFRTTHIQGQGPSLHEQFSDSRDRNALVYFCEDDYLHEADALIEMWEFYRQVYGATSEHCVIYPQEHETLYTSYYPSYILAGAKRRWRTMNDATHTFFTHGHVVDRYWKYFENTKYMGVRDKRHLASERVTTNRLYDHIPGFSPIPPVAVHLQYEELLPPFYDWRPLWDANPLDRPLPPTE